jgi:hypothetical protein
MDRSIMALTGPLWVHYGHNGLVKALIDRKSILEQNNVLAVVFII